MKLAVRILYFFVAIMSHAVFATEMPFASGVTSGFRNSALVAYVNPPSEERQLALTIVAKPIQAKKILDELFQKNNAKALLAARGSEVFYERYSFSTGRRDTPLGYSMSKSLTALTVGRALCDGKIGSLDDDLKKYVPELAGTSWGDATVRSVLKMASGAYRTNIQFDGHKSREMQQMIGEAIAAGKMSESFVDIMRLADERSFEPGKQFNYSNLDTVALGLLVQGATGVPFATYFERTVWADAGAESRGAWFVNGNKQTSTYNGFSARPHDWLRLGVMVLRELRNQESCFGRYLKEATTKQADSFGPANSYGYQIWVKCGSSDFCFVGYGGQYLLFNVEKNIVVYQHATTFSNVVWATPSIMSGLVQGLEAVDSPR